MPHLRDLFSTVSLFVLPTIAVVACGGSDDAAGGAPPGSAETDGGGDSAAPPVLPSGTIVFPKSDVWTPEATGRVIGTATPPPSRTIMQVTVDGNPAKTTNGYADWTVDVDLKPGANPLTLRVIDNEGEISTTTGITITSNRPLLNGIATEGILVKDGIVYAGDGSDVVSFAVGGGPRTKLASIDGGIVHHLAIDGTTLYAVMRDGKFGSVPLGGGVFMPVGNVLPNARGMTLAGGKLVLLTRFLSLGGGASSLPSYPLAGGDVEPLALTYGTTLDIEILDYDVANGSFYAAVGNHKPLVMPAAGGAVTDLDISRNTGAGVEYPKLIKVSGGTIYVSFDAGGTSWYTTALAGGALTPAPLKLPADAAPRTRFAIDGNACYFPAFFGGIE